MISDEEFKDFKIKERTEMLEKGICPKGYKYQCRESYYKGNGELCIAVPHNPNKVLQLKCVYRRGVTQN